MEKLYDQIFNDIFLHFIINIKIDDFINNYHALQLYTLLQNKCTLISSSSSSDPVSLTLIPGQVKFEWSMVGVGDLGTSENRDGFHVPSIRRRL